MQVNLYAAHRTRLTQVELNTILAEHERFVRSTGGIRAMLKLKDLSGLSLANRCLDDADFTGASLAGANAYGSSFIRSNLYCADLRLCNLRNAKLTQADLRGACFCGADLAGAVLDYSDMRVAIMAQAGAEGIRKYQHGDLEDGALVEGVDFRNASLRNVSFGSAKLVSPNFSGAVMHGAKFAGAKFTNPKFEGAVLTGVNLAELNVPPETLKSCITDPSPETMSKAGALRQQIESHARWVETGGAHGIPAVIDGADLRPLGSFFKKRNLVGLCARNVIAIGIDFSGCGLQGAKFAGADLRGAFFADCDLSGTSFKAAKLHHARFDRAKLGSLRLQSGEMMPTCLAEAEASAEQFSLAAIDGALSDFDFVPSGTNDPAATASAA